MFSIYRLTFSSYLYFSLGGSFQAYFFLGRSYSFLYLYSLLFVFLKSPPSPAFSLYLLFSWYLGSAIQDFELSFFQFGLSSAASGRLVCFLDYFLLLYYFSLLSSSFSISSCYFFFRSMMGLAHLTQSIRSCYSSYLSSSFSYLDSRESLSTLSFSISVLQFLHFSYSGLSLALVMESLS